ncbi:regulatory protein RecX [Ruminiclostridium cellulolyticum]|uniref:Regulatory protein RecX n=1 Tax=Ruminiclostridium cellulolyticum (strain ATCC 35319 / DSM 5812 / JCM 6584 / H10) TaxID=394503 RepID=B8I7D3_RUMCH|nr:regulatory protein RecX [Ruminiclostridium cellulolyticum]ACL75057.1 regulatory protein RecX [Ruminiclostridium cellulolyticum H10]
MRITSIEKSDNNKSMARVCIDNGAEFVLPLKRIDALNLTIDKDIEQESLDYILKYEVYAAAKNAAVKFLSLKLRTSFEVEEKLREMGYEESTINKVISDLAEIEYINDYKYAAKYIAEKTKLKPKSIKLLAMELGHKGIPDEIINSTIEELNPDDEKVALELLKRRYSKYNEFDEKLIKKMKSYLASRGFSYNQISKAISKFIPEDGYNADFNCDKY